MRIHLLLLLCWLAVQSLSAAILPPGFIETPLATGLDPTALAQTPDGRIFVTEKYGAVRVVENGQLLPDPLIRLTVDNANERGLSGIALHPNFEQNGWIYLFFTLPNAGKNRLSRFRVFGNYADPATEQILLETGQMAGSIHNGGAMVFGADGMLYVAIGDGANGAAARNMSSLLGKVIRLRDDGAIPTDNPFYQQHAGVYRAIYASGLRNPFSMSVQAGTGRIYICDVGSDFYEEVNELSPGADFGWNTLEGKKTTQNLPGNYRDPVYAYPHTLGCAVVGAAFYNPPNPQFPADYTGKFFFADYCQSYIKLFNPATGQVEGNFATQIDRPLVLMTGLDGALYYISRGGLGGGSEQDNTSSLEGMLWKVTYVGAGAPVFSVHPKSSLISAGESAVFSVQVNGSTPLSYQWERDSQLIAGAIGSSLELSNLQLSDSGAVIRCAATNAFGQVWSQRATLRVTANQRPMPVITTPDDTYRYRAGAPVLFSGFATDPETGTLSADDLSWRVDLHHDAHTHPGMAATPGIENGSFTLPVLGETAENVWLRLSLSAKDPAGLSRTVYKDIFPEKARLRIESDPPGISIRTDGKTNATPYETATVRGLRRLVETPRLTEIGGNLYVFKQWEDGSEFPQRTLYPQDSSLTIRARYDVVKKGTGSGLLGSYHLGDASGKFLNKVFDRVDSTINFDWKGYAPDLRLPNDYFAIRWQGVVEPWFSSDYTFIVNSDDGCRLWVNGQLLLDAWYPKEEYDLASGVIRLEGGKRYDIQLEYYEIGGLAAARLYWATPNMEKNIIPKTQLYPRLPAYVGGVKANLDFHVQPNPVRGEALTLRVRATHREQVRIRLVDPLGKVLVEREDIWIEEPDQLIELPIGDLSSGSYWIQMEGRLYGGRKVEGIVKI